MKALKIKKSSSLPSINFDVIEFNPNEFQVGRSKISNLPFHQQKSSIQAASTPFHELLELRAKNQKLKMENAQLKKKIEYYMSSQIEKIKKAQQSNNTSKDYKNTFLSKMNKSKQPSTLCETGLFLSKCTVNQIGEIYDSWKQRNVELNSEKLLSVTKKCFQEFQQNFLKLKVMSESIYGGQNCKFKRQLQDHLTLFKVPILFKKNPQLLAKSLNKSNQKGHSLSKFQPETKSFQETIAILQNIIKKTLKSQKMLEMVKVNPIITSFLKTILAQI